MTKRRVELIFEGSRDGEFWYEYRMRYKPNALDKMPPWIIPHQPRLDWQMWFAALSNVDSNRWLYAAAAGLLADRQAVKSFFRVNPFPEKPPKYIRIVAWDYHFTTFEEKAKTGDWWKRKPLGIYGQPMSLE
jgi:hypothetical protein